MSKNGKEFEVLTGLIERTLRGRKCEILLNHNISNKYGIKREIDVYIKTNNGNIAIECKDWRGKNNRIKMELIDAFHGKTSEIEEINKKIYVARGSYQSGAKLLAKGLGIELFKLSEVNDRRIIGWIDFEQLKKLHVEREIRFPGIVIVNAKGTKGYLHDNQRDITLDVEGEGNFTLEHILTTNLEFYRGEVQDNSLECFNRNILRFSQEHIFRLDDKVMWYTRERTKYKVLIIRCICDYSVIPSTVDEINFLSYYDEKKESEIANVANVMFTGTSEKLIFIKDKSTGKESVYIQEIIENKIESTELNDRKYES